MGIGDGDAASDDSGFPGEYNDEFDEAIGEAAGDDDFLADDNADVDRPLLQIAEQAEAEEAHAEAREADAELNALPQNRFATTFQRFAASHGDNMRRVNKDGELKARSGHTHPNTRTVKNFQRTGMLRHPPRRETRQGHSDYNYAVTLLKTSAQSQMRKVLKGHFRTLRRTRKTPMNTKHALLSKTNDETEFPVRFTAKESKKWVAWQMTRINRERYLTKEDIQELKEVMESNHVGIAHVLSQHCRVRFGPGQEQPAIYDVVVPSCSVQRTSASNLSTAAEELPFKEVSFSH